MDAIKMFERPETITWDYDAEADVLYLSIGEPKPAVGVEVGDGLVVMYDEGRCEVVGLTIMSLRHRLLKELAESE